MRWSDDEDRRNQDRSARIRFPIEGVEELRRRVLAGSSGEQVPRRHVADIWFFRTDRGQGV